MIGVPSFRRDFGYLDAGQYILPAKWQAAFNNVSSVGQFFGGFLCSQVADRIGRKKSIAVGIVICTGGIIGQVVTTTKGGFLAAKLVLGLGLGFYLTLGPLCCSEVSRQRRRSRTATDYHVGYPSRPSWHLNSRSKLRRCHRPAHIQRRRQRAW